MCLFIIEFSPFQRKTFTAGLPVGLPNKILQKHIPLTYKAGPLGWWLSFPKVPKKHARCMCALQG